MIVHSIFVLGQTDILIEVSVRRQPGFTLVELVLTILVMSIAVVGLSSALGFSLRHQSDGVWQIKSVALAQAYLEEISARNFDENTPVGGLPACNSGTCSAISNDGEARALFDDVDDYDGIDDAPPLDVNGVARAGYSGYRVQVVVRYANAGEITSWVLDDSTDLKLVTVTVTPPSGSAMQFTALKGNY